ncbi:hypothetical protein [Achromobacter animicus]|uniref:bestrophin-like domain n=1 Tax=Achromobacter animicus TaxID=1389935 RepID=UPI003463EA97
MHRPRDLNCNNFHLPFPPVNEILQCACMRAPHWSTRTGTAVSRVGCACAIASPRALLLSLMRSGRASVPLARSSGNRTREVPMDYSFLLAGLAAAFFVALFGAIALGKRLGRKLEENGGAGVAAIEASVFALLGLLVAFTFSGAAQRMSDRRDLLIQEVNAIGTAWLRVDLLPPAAQPALRAQFRHYVDQRILYERHVADLDARTGIAAKASALQMDIWRASVRAARDDVAPPLAASYVQAVNDMFDAATALVAAQKVHPPMAAYVFLGFLALICAGLVGVKLAATQRGTLLHELIYALVMTAALYIIIDFEFPRIGTIRIDQSDALLVSQRQAMVDPPSSRP